MKTPRDPRLKQSTQQTKRHPKGGGPVGDPPDRLDDAEAGLWRDIVEAAPPGLLTSTDRNELEEYCAAVGLCRRLRRALVGADLEESDKLLMEYGKAVVRLRQLSNDLGLNPTARSKFVLEPADAFADEDDLAKHL